MPYSVTGQQSVHLHEHPVLSSIEEAREAGRLSLDESILQKFSFAYRADNLMAEFGGDADSVPIKCMVPVYQNYLEVKDQLSASTVGEVESMVYQSDSDTEFSYLSPSGVFVFHYDTTGSHGVSAEQTMPGAIEAGIPDYIYKAAFAADSSYRYQVEDTGFTDFARSTPYEVHFRNFGFYGTTTSSGNTTFITIHSNFNNFPPNTHPEGDRIGALYVTMAHEIKHAIQYAANRWRGSAGSFNWIEMDATMMEEVVFDDVNDYYNYIMLSFGSSTPGFSSIFGNPQNPTPGAYWHVTWMLYFWEVYGIEFWVDVWQVVENEPLIPFFDAIETTLQSRGQSLEREHLKNHTWHLGSGERFQNADFGFREREFYPVASTEFEFFSVPDSVSQTGLRSMAANYVRASVPSTALGQPAVRLESSAPGTGIGVIALFNDGTASKMVALNRDALAQNLQTPWNWRDISELYISVVNTNRSRTSNYTLYLESALPEEDVLARNYPNPFFPTTRIEFSLNHQKDVKLEVYDSIGRKIRTLIDDRLNEGFHFVDFDGSGLASGVYFYRIITDETVTTNKMIMVK